MKLDEISVEELVEYIYRRGLEIDTEAELLRRLSEGERAKEAMEELDLLYDCINTSEYRIENTRKIIQQYKEGK